MVTVGPIGRSRFLTRDPLLPQTQSAYGYAGDNPVNLTDPSGLSTSGYCGSFSGSLFTANGSVDVCLVKDNHGETAFTVSGGGGLSISLSAIKAYIQSLTNPEKILRLFSGSAGVGYQTSNASTVCQLSGPFFNAGGSFGIWFAQVSWDHFWNGQGISGNLRVAGGQLKGLSFGGHGGVTDTKVVLLSGWQASAADVAISVLNHVNPLRL